MVEQVDIEAADEIVSAANVTTVDGYYEVDVDKVAAIVSRIRIAAEARGMEKAAKIVEAYSSVKCGEGMVISAMRDSAKEFGGEIRRAALNGGQHE